MALNPTTKTNFGSHAALNEEKNVQPSALCRSSTKSAVSSAITVICTSDCVSSNEDARLELPTKSESTKSAVPSPALVNDSLFTEQTEDASLQPSAMPDIESWTKGAASSSLRRTTDVAISAAKEYLPEIGSTDQTRNFVIINGSTNDAMEGQINVAESIKVLYSWIAGTKRPENLPAQFELVCMLTFHDVECTDFGCEHTYTLETEAGRTPSVALLSEVLVIKKIGDELDGTLTGFDDVYFSV